MFKKKSRQTKLAFEEICFCSTLCVLNIFICPLVSLVFCMNTNTHAHTQLCEQYVSSRGFWGLGQSRNCVYAEPLVIGLTTNLCWPQACVCVCGDGVGGRDLLPNTPERHRAEAEIWLPTTSYSTSAWWQLSHSYTQHTFFTSVGEQNRIASPLTHSETWPGCFCHLHTQLLKLQRWW